VWEEVILLLFAVGCAGFAIKKFLVKMKLKRAAFSQFRFGTENNRRTLLGCAGFAQIYFSVQSETKTSGIFPLSVWNLKPIFWLKGGGGGGWWLEPFQEKSFPYFLLGDGGGGRGRD
jgi:hypothetical protein